MITWKEKYLVPNVDTTHIVDGYEDICGCARFDIEAGLR